MQVYVREQGSPRDPDMANSTRWTASATVTRDATHEFLVHSASPHRKHQYPVTGSLLGVYKGDQIQPSHIPPPVSRRHVPTFEDLDKLLVPSPSLNRASFPTKWSDILS